MITYRELKAKIEEMSDYELDTLVRVESYNEYAESYNISYLDDDCIATNEAGDKVLRDEEAVRVRWIQSQR